MLHDPGTAHQYGWPAINPVFHSSPARLDAEDAWQKRDDVLEQMLDGHLPWNQSVLDAMAEQAEALERKAHE